MREVMSLDLDIYFSYIFGPLLASLEFKSNFLMMLMEPTEEKTPTIIGLVKLGRCIAKFLINNKGANNCCV